MKCMNTVLQSPLSSVAPEGSSGLLWTRGWAHSMCSLGTSDAGGLWTLCSSIVSMPSMGSISEDASLHVQEILPYYTVILKNAIFQKITDAYLSSAITLNAGSTERMPNTSNMSFSLKLSQSSYTCQLQRLHMWDSCLQYVLEPLKTASYHIIVNYSKL